MALAFLPPGPSWAQTRSEDPVIAVVVAAGSAASSPLGTAAVANIFRRKRRFWDDQTPVVPVNLPAGHPLRRDFSLRLLGRSPQDLQAYWNDQYFHGVLPPPVVASEEAVLRFVVETPGAIGYVWSCNVDKRVQAVAMVTVPGGSNACPR